MLVPTPTFRSRWNQNKQPTAQLFGTNYHSGASPHDLANPVSLCTYGWLTANYTSACVCVIGRTFRGTVDGVAVTATSTIRRLQVAHQLHQVTSVTVQLKTNTDLLTTGASTIYLHKSAFGTIL